MAIIASGIGSGIDVGGLVSQLVAAEGQPALNRLNTKQARLQTDLSAFGALKGALSAFQSSVSALNDLEAFQARKATSSDTTLFSATADTTAVAGSYTIEVTQLAKTTKIRSGDFTSEEAVVGRGTLDITMGADTFQISVDENNETLEGIRDAINAASDNPGVTASIINVDDGGGGTVSRLVLTGGTVGATNSIDIVVTDDDGIHTDTTGLSQLATTNFTTVQAAQDAIIKIDGQFATRDSNSFSDVIPGVTFNLNKAEVDTVETLTVELNVSAVKSKVNSFVSAYNSLTDLMRTMSSYDAETGATGVLQGDSTLRSIQNQIRQKLVEPVSGLDYGTLSEIGVTTDDKGHLTLDSEKLDTVLESDFEAVSQLFASENGLANSLDSLLEQYTGSDGSLGLRTDGIQSRIDSIADDRLRLDKRLTALSERYTIQFNAMDLLVSNLNSQSSFLMQQLDNLPGTYTPKN